MGKPQKKDKQHRQYQKKKGAHSISEEVYDNEQNDKIEGRNPVMEALKAGRQMDKMLVQQGEKQGSIVPIISLAKAHKIVVQEVAKQKLDMISTTQNHQGVIAFAAMHNYVEVQDILEKAAQKGEPPFIIVVDEITDPHNLGSILRTANAAGAHGIIIPKRRAVGLTAVVAKASAGAIEYVPVAKVTNIAQTIDALKEQGIWIVGADAYAKQEIYEANLTGAIGLVIGSEGNGLSRLTKEKCDFLVHIPMKGEIESLNASVAAAVMMYEVVRQKEGK